MDRNAAPRVTRLVFAFAMIAFGALACGDSRLQRPILNDWRVEYQVTGGIDGRNLVLTLGSDGQLAAENKRLGTKTIQSAPAALMTKVTRIVQELDLNRKTLPPVFSAQDQLAISSEVVLRDQRYSVDLPREVSDWFFVHLNEIFSQVKTVPLDLGKIWKIEEGFAGDETDWEGVWVRRGESNVFDATWRNRWLTETKTDVIEVETAQSGQVVLLRHGIRMRYRGKYSPDHPNKLSGTADWYGPGVVWKATIER